MSPWLWIGALGLLALGFAYAVARDVSRYEAETRRRNADADRELRARFVQRENER